MSALSSDEWRQRQLRKVRKEFSTKNIQSFDEMRQSTAHTHTHIVVEKSGSRRIIHVLHAARNYVSRT